MSKMSGLPFRGPKVEPPQPPKPEFTQAEGERAILALNVIGAAVSGRKRAEVQGYIDGLYGFLRVAKACARKQISDEPESERTKNLHDDWRERLTRQAEEKDPPKDTQ